MTQPHFNATVEALTAKLAELNAAITMRGPSPGMQRRYLMQQVETARRFYESIGVRIPTPEQRLQREPLIRDLMNLHRSFLVEFPEQGSFQPLLLSRYGVTEIRLMTVEQCHDFRDYLRAVLNMEPATV